MPPMEAVLDIQGEQPNKLLTRPTLRNPVNSGSNMEQIEEHVLMTLPDAAQYLFKDRSRVSTLRTAIRKGHLKPARIAGTFFVTVTDLQEMNKRCRDEREDHTSISEAKPKPTSSATSKKNSPQDAALSRLRKLKDNSANTSPQNGSQKSSATVVPIARQSS